MNRILHCLTAAFLLASLPALDAQEAASPGAAVDNDLEALQIPNTPVDQVLVTYEQLTNKRLLRSPNLVGPNIRLVVSEPLSKAERARLIEAALLLNGFSLVPGPDNTVKVLNIGQKNPRSEGVPIYTRLEDLPPGDQVVSFFMPLTYLDTGKFTQIVQQNASGNPYAGIMDLKDAGAVVVTDNTSYIRQLVKLKELADVPPARLTREFVQMERADAERVAETINQLIQGRRQGQQQGQVPQPGAEAAAQLGGGNTLAGDIQLTPDRRTNRILVICAPTAFATVRDLILQFDEEVALEKPTIRPLKYISAAEVLPVLGELLSEEEGDLKKGTAGASGSRPRTPAAQPRTTGGSSGSGSSFSREEQLSAPDEDQAPVSVSVGKTRLIADKRSNAIFIIGSPESVNKVSTILDGLDIRPRQVFLSTVIGQLTLTRETEFGVDILNKYNNGIAGQSNQARSTPFIDPKTLLTAGAFPAGAAGLTLYGAFGDTIDAYVRAFESTNNFKVLSRPSVFTANNKKAMIVSGRREPVPTQTITDISGGNINSSINYEEVVLRLEVVPLINADNEVTLQISQDNDSIVDTRIISDNEVPVIGKQSVNTTIKVNNNSTVILGGLIEDQAQRQESGIPLLKDIPLLGYLFKTTNVDRPRRELIIMIQPRVVGEDETEETKSTEEMQRYLVAPDAREAAESTKPVRTQIKRPR